MNFLLYYEGYQAEHNVDRFLPDGNTEMIIDLNEAPQYIYDNSTLKEKQACNRVWVSGVRTQPITIPSGKHSKMIVISFKKGMAYPFYPLPLNELTNHVVDADHLYKRAILDMRENIQETHSISQVFIIVERFLMSIGRHGINKSMPADCVNYAITQILQNPSSTVLSELSRKIGYSQKHFISLFKKQVGLTPKNYLNVIRFQKVILDIEKQNEIDWATMAFNCGYYDQAHFINDFKHFSGFTPNSYLAKKNDMLNYVPVG